LWWGLLWVVVAGTLTAVIIFWLGQRVLREPVTQILDRHPKIKAVDAATSDSGLRLIFLLRLAPLNYTLLCWLLSVSKVHFRTYLISCLGMFPGNFSTVYLGFAARHTADLATRIKAGDPPIEGDSLVHEITLYSGLVISMIVSLMVARIAMRAIHAASTPAPTAADDQ
ncbi:MAG: VTT domain-containing protein, partial [Phycisphaerales bacterium]